MPEARRERARPESDAAPLWGRAQESLCERGAGGPDAPYRRWADGARHPLRERGNDAQVGALRRGADDPGGVPQRETAIGALLPFRGRRAALAILEGGTLRG